MAMSVFGVPLLAAYLCAASSSETGVPEQKQSPQGITSHDSSQRASDVPLHVKVYHQPGRFGGWPGNHGIWSWGNEILVGFSAGYFQDHGPARHAIDHDKPEVHVLARSRDGGRTWTIETRHRARPLATHLVGLSDLDDDQRAGVEAMLAPTGVRTAIPSGASPRSRPAAPHSRAWPPWATRS